MKHKDETSSPLILVVFGLACVAIIPAWINFDIISMDGAFQYIPTAEVFLEGRFKDALVRPQLPLYPLLMAMMSWLVGISPELAGRLIAGTCFVLAGFGIFKVTQAVFQNRWPALLASIFLVTNPELVIRSVDCLKESLFLALMVWGNYLLLRRFTDLEQQSALSTAAGAALLILGVLVRTTAILFIAAWLMIWVFHVPEGRLRRFLIVISPVIAGIFLIIFFPHWGIFHRKGFAVFTYFSMFPGFFGLFNGASRVIGEFFMTGNPALILCAIISLVMLESCVYRIHAALVLVFFLAITLFMGWTSDRYILAPIIWIYPASAVIVHRMIGRNQRIMRVVGYAIVLSCVVLWGAKVFSPPDPDRLARKVAGQWIQAQSDSPVNLVTNRPRIAYYAGTKPKNPGRKIQSGVWIAIDERGPEGATLVKKLESEGREPTVIFDNIRIYLPEP